MKEVNVDSIISELKEKARKKSYEQPLKDFNEVVLFESSESFQSEKFDLDFMLESILNANAYYYLDADIKITGKFKFVKKLIRKMIAFCINPIVKHSNDYNTYVIRSINQFRNYLYQSYEYSEMMKSIETTINVDVQKSLKIADNKITRLNEQVNVLEEKYNDLLMQIKNR